MNRALVLAGLLAMGCAGRRGPAGVVDAPAVLAEARSRAMPFALQGRFSVHIAAGDLDVSTSGAVILHPPDRFRVEIYSPFGTPLVYVLSDGRSIDLYDANARVFYQGDDAASVLAELSSGAVGLVDVVRLLTGTLPLSEAEVRSVEAQDRSVRVVLDGPGEVLVNAALDPRTSLLQSLEVADGEGPALLSLRYLDDMRVGKDRLPEEMSFEVPTLGLRVDIEMRSWDELGAIPDAFTLSPPPGTTERDLVEAIREQAERRAARPQP